MYLVDVWKDDSVFRFSVSGFRCEDLTLLRFYLQMLNDKMLKPNNKTCLKCKYRLKHLTISKEKLQQLIESAFFEKWE